ncbi:sigma-54-dependent Fis family transcriptional regulator [Aliikangiella marina]|uniref:Sigma-54-dependent Fis family transcriptional regulator n=1 Tax=Aliikangiella marina TaxID=1712262 RepID=A0A545TDN6_9GAMM|nr:sigma-54 dependent transcriptional regulator [Aliikangiella marina]TQV75329.1 sigma-54-dependent Fis family transcriptional regulator [Aliikangiella marina]
MNSSVLVVEDDQVLRDALCASLEVNGYQTIPADCGESALNLLSGDSLPDMVVTDIQMGNVSGIDLLRNLRRRSTNLPVILMTAYGDVSDAVEAMRLGACDYLQKPFEAGKLTHLIENYLPKTVTSQVIIEDPASQAVFGYAEKIAKTDSTVLLHGPSGAGKEVMARFIHRNSSRSEYPFVAINCAAIPENMLEATLFGYEKGAFTGAHQANPGKFEQAQNGTLLLDEISEMDLGLQAKILRVIQEKEVERLGGKKSIDLDVRIIATTNRDLKREVAEKRFREDLYYRLNVFPIKCLPLKERPKDIIPLFESLLAANDSVRQRGGLTISPEAKAKLVSYAWPGNVRELDNLVQRVAVLAADNLVMADDICFENEVLGNTNESSDNEVQSDGQLGSDLQHHEFQLIIEAFNTYNGKKKDIAEGLGISPRTLRYKLAKMRELGYEIPNCRGKK